MDVSEVRRLIATIQNAARRAHDAGNREVLAKECSALTSMLAQMLSPLMFASDDSTDAEHQKAEMLVEHFLRVWLCALRPQFESALADSFKTRTPVIEQLAEHFIGTLTLIVLDKYLLPYYSSNIEFEARRICSSLLEATGKVLDARPPSKPALLPSPKRFIPRLVVSN